MAREIETNLLKETLIYSMAINIKNDIIKLKQMLTTPANEQYLACWFYFFEKNLKIQEQQYQWMQDILNSFNEKIMTDEQKENKFISFKFKREILFPWDEQVEFELFEASLLLEEQRTQKENSKISKKIKMIKIELYCKLSNKKLELKEKFLKNIEKQDNLLALHNNSVQNF